MNARTHPFPHTLRALARLLCYPDADWRAHLPALADALQQEHALSPRRLEELSRSIRLLAACDPFELEAAYVETFDRGRRTALNLFEHVHGDSRDRGPAMVDLAKTYESRGFRMRGGELPDFLPLVLEFASTLPPRDARAFLTEFAHIVRTIFSALIQTRNVVGLGCASALAAVLELAGVRAEPVALPAEPALDDAYDEPAAFAGCTAAGQTRPAVQPIRFVQSARAGAPRHDTTPSPSA